MFIWSLSFSVEAYSGFYVRQPRENPWYIVSSFTDIIDQMSLEVRSYRKMSFTHFRTIFKADINHSICSNIFLNLGRFFLSKFRFFPQMWNGLKAGEHKEFSLTTVSWSLWNNPKFILKQLYRMSFQIRNCWLQSELSKV
jgi:hypothetical protein